MQSVHVNLAAYKFIGLDDTLHAAEDNGQNKKSAKTLR